MGIKDFGFVLDDPPTFGLLLLNPANLQSDYRTWIPYDHA